MIMEAKKRGENSPRFCYVSVKIGVLCERGAGPSKRDKTLRVGTETLPCINFQAVLLLSAKQGGSNLFLKVILNPEENNNKDAEK